MTEAHLQRSHAVAHAPIDQEFSVAEAPAISPENRILTLQQQLRSELQLLVSLEPGTWSSPLANTQGYGFEATLGARGLSVESNNTTVEPLIDLIENGYCKPLYFNSVSEAQLGEFEVTLKRGQFQSIQNEPVVLIQGHLPSDAISSGVVLGPSPFAKRMEAGASLALESINRIAFVTPERFELTAEGLNPRDSNWAVRYLANIEYLSQFGISAEPGSAGALFQETLGKMLQQENVASHR